MTTVSATAEPRVLRRDLVRILLDSIAIALGVTGVILAVAVNHGSSNVSGSAVNGLGPDVVVVAGTAPSGSGIQAGFDTSSLTSADVAALGNTGYVPDALTVAPTVGLTAAINSGSGTDDTDVVGTTNTFSDVLGYSVGTGRFLTAADVQNDAPVVVLGEAVASGIFPEGNAIGQTVVINGDNFQVVGTLKPKGYSGTYDQDNLVVLPITTVWKELTPSQGQQIDQVLIRAASPAGAKLAAQEATNTLLSRHNITDPALADFTVIRQADLVADQTQAATAVKRILELAALALLLVGMLHLFQRVRTRSSEQAKTVAETLLVGPVAVVLGIVLAAILAPTLHHLSPVVPSSELTLYGVVAGAVIGLVAAVIPVLPSLPPTHELSVQLRALRRRSV
jgi:putative ABC transport system permease protein